MNRRSFMKLIGVVVAGVSLPVCKTIAPIVDSTSKVWSNLDTRYRILCIEDSISNSSTVSYSLYDSRNNCSKPVYVTDDWNNMLKFCEKHK